jgi:hypothetical protein
MAAVPRSPTLRTGTEHVHIDLSTSDVKSQATKKEMLILSDDEDEDEDGDASRTEVEDGVSPHVLATLKNQQRGKLINNLLKKAMLCTENTDAESIKRVVLRFKERMYKFRGPNNKSTSSGERTHDSGF